MLISYGKQAVNSSPIKLIMFQFPLAQEQKFACLTLSITAILELKSTTSVHAHGDTREARGTPFSHALLNFSYAVPCSLSHGKQCSGHPGCHRAKWVLWNAVCCM